MNIIKETMSVEVHAFLKSLINPDMYGHAVTAEVRDEARVLLGMKKVETKRKKKGFALEEY